MKTIPPRTALARMRKILGLGQTEMADVSGLPHATWQSLELGRLALSAANAARIGEAFGVDPACLLKNLRAVRTIQGEPFTKLKFEGHRAILAAGNPGQEFRWFAKSAMLNLAAIGGSASKKKQLRLFAFRVQNMIQTLGAEFGFDKAGFWQLVGKFKSLPPEFQLSVIEGDASKPVRVTVPADGETMRTLLRADGSRSRVRDEVAVEVDGKRVLRKPRETRGPCRLTCHL